MVLLIFALWLSALATSDVQVVVASKRENTLWTKRLKYPAIVYKPNVTNYPYTTTYDKGFEACMYLAFIIDNYHQLPEYTIFTHGHQSSWHSPDLVELINRLDVTRFQYVNFNVNYFCTVSESTKVKAHHRRSLEDFNREVMSFLTPTPPTEYSTYCCAQFLVHRDRIRSRPLEFYLHADQWLQQTNYSSPVSGRLFEYVWGFIFTNESSPSPLPHGYCSVVNCTDAELKNRKKYFRLKLSPNIFWSLTAV
jgi:hypothetical protein